MSQVAPKEKRKRKFKSFYNLTKVEWRGWGMSAVRMRHSFCLFFLRCNTNWLMTFCTSHLFKLFVKFNFCLIGAHIHILSFSLRAGQEGGGIIYSPCHRFFCFSDIYVMHGWYWVVNRTTSGPSLFSVSLLNKGHTIRRNKRELFACFIWWIRDIYSAQVCQ